MIVTLVLIIIIASFSIALAVTWWLLTDVLPWLIFIYFLFLVLRYLIRRVCREPEREPDTGDMRSDSQTHE